MDTLKGISRVKVELDISDVCVKKHALTPEQVTSMIEERLLQTGLRIIERADPEDGGAVVYTRIALVGDLARCSYSIDLVVAKAVNNLSVPTNFHFTDPIWNRSDSGICTCEEAPIKAHDRLHALLDRFVNDFRAAKPRLAQCHFSSAQSE